MSHACPECGQQCYCDLEDHDSEAPDDCCHDCDLDDDEEVLFSGEMAFPQPQRNDGGQP
jgi:hypothetical protein